MLKTSYFARSAKDPGAVSIARFPPKWYTGARYLPLAPPAALLKIGDWDLYRRRYHEEVLSSYSTRMRCSGTWVWMDRLMTSSSSALRKTGPAVTGGWWLRGCMRPGGSRSPSSGKSRSRSSPSDCCGIIRS
jgi:hypothetical protein